MKRRIQTFVGLIIGLGLMWFLFRDTNWPEVWSAIKRVDITWLLLSQIPLWLSFPLRVQRWSYIVRATQPVAWRKLFAATQIGFLANFTLPARLGEIIRALVLTRLTAIPFSKSIALVALDRLSDLFGLIVVMLIAVVAYQPEGTVVIPKEVFGGAAPIEFPASQYRAGAIGIGIVLSVVVAGFVLLYLNRRLILAISDALVGLVSKTVAAKVHGMINHFADGLHVFRSPREMAKALTFSMLTWLTGTIFLWTMLQAFEIDAPWYTAVVMQAMLAVFIAAPGAPGFVGQFHAPIVIALVMILPGIDVNHAKAFAIVNHLLNFPPLIILAAYSLMTEHLGIAELGVEGARIAEAEDESRAQESQSV